jgi:hypothetical protein
MLLASYLWSFICLFYLPFLWRFFRKKRNSFNARPPAVILQMLQKLAAYEPHLVHIRARLNLQSHSSTMYSSKAAMFVQFMRQNVPPNIHDAGIFLKAGISFL